MKPDGDVMNKKQWQKVIVLQIVIVVTLAGTSLLTYSARDLYVIHTEEGASPQISLTYLLERGHDYWIDIVVTERSQSFATVEANVSIYFNGTLYSCRYLVDASSANQEAVATALTRVHVYATGDTHLAVNGTMDGDSWVIKVFRDVPQAINVIFNVALLSFLVVSLSLVYTMFTYYRKFLSHEGEQASETQNSRDE